METLCLKTREIRARRVIVEIESYSSLLRPSPIKGTLGINSCLIGRLLITW
jgi:hypothetical protein